MLSNVGVLLVMKKKEPAPNKKSGAARRRGQRLLQALRGKGTVRMTTDQIMALTRGEC